MLKPKGAASSKRPSCTSTSSSQGRSEESGDLRLPCSVRALRPPDNTHNLFENTESLYTLAAPPRRAAFAAAARSRAPLTMPGRGPAPPPTPLPFRTSPLVIAAAGCGRPAIPTGGPPLPPSRARTTTAAEASATATGGASSSSMPSESSEPECQAAARAPAPAPATEEEVAAPKEERLVAAVPPSSNASASRESDGVTGGGKGEAGTASGRAAELAVRTRRPAARCGSAGGRTGGAGEGSQEGPRGGELAASRKARRGAGARLPLARDHLDDEECKHQQDVLGGGGDEEASRGGDFATLTFACRGWKGKKVRERQKRRVHGAHPGICRYPPFPWAGFCQPTFVAHQRVRPA
eukprot:scaffold4566_cov118-Isochrysis_galbana.AAC.4